MLEIEGLSPEETLILLTLIEEDHGYRATINVTDTLFQLDPDRAALVIHGWVTLLNDLMSEMLEHVDNDPIDMYIH